MAKTLFLVVVIIVVAGYLLETILDFLNKSTWEKRLPESLKDFYTEEQYQKARSYYFENHRLSFYSGLLGFVVLLLFLLSGGFGWLHLYLSGLIKQPVWLALVYFGILFFISDLISIPFQWYRTFVIEEKYGFNKTTPGIFIMDKIKSYLLTAILGGGIMAIILVLIFKLGNQFWWIAFLVVLLFSILMNMFYTTLIVPLFNKLSPLEEGELKQSIENYAARVGFPLDKIMVIDGSKRSTKANAFFSGLGKKKKIVLYDTLIQKHTIPELVAVLAHEVGHYKKKHVVKGLIISALQTFVMFYLLSLVIFNTDFTAALFQNVFGFHLPAPEGYVVHINLMVFAVLYEPLSMVLSLITHVFSRKHEYQADYFAVTTTNSFDLPSALKKLSTDHLSHLKPHPLYEFFYYSHPSLMKRLEAIRQIQNHENQK